MGPAIEEDLHRRSSLRTTPLVRARFVVGEEVGVEGGLHLLDGLGPGSLALDAEVLVEQRAVEALDDAFGLGPLHPGEALVDAFELEKELVGMAVGPAAELAAVSLRATSIVAFAASKAGSTSSLRRCTAVIGSLEL